MVTFAVATGNLIFPLVRVARVLRTTRSARFLESGGIITLGMGSPQAIIFSFRSLSEWKRRGRREWPKSGGFFYISKRSPVVMDFCEVCFPIHGPGCAPSYRDEKGRAVCVFCFDGVPCPRQLEILKEARARKARENEMKTADKIAIPVRIPTAAQPSPAAKSPAATVRLCKYPGCKRRLVWNNQCGLCTGHRPAGGSAPKANGHDRAPAVIGKALPGNTRELTANERVDLLFAVIPLEDKIRMLAAWLQPGNSSADGAALHLVLNDMAAAV